MLVIISCGSKKLDRPARARDLYTGPYFKAALAYALKLAPAKDVFILSAKYGIVGLNDELDPYDLKMGESGSVNAATVREQAENYGLLKEKVTVLGGRLYVDVCYRVWREVSAPLLGTGGLGQQIAWMSEQTKKGA